MDTTDYSEMLPVVNEQGEVTGKTTRKEDRGKLRPLHPVVHLHVFNSRGELYLQKRPQWKDVQPGKWDTATGGHVGYGESIENALVREVAEELGITGFAPVFLGRYTFESNVERELVHVFRTLYDGPVTPDANELDDGRFWSAEEIAEAMGKGVLTPNFESEYKRFFLCKQ